MNLIKITKHEAQLLPDIGWQSILGYLKEKGAPILDQELDGKVYFALNPGYKFTSMQDVEFSITITWDKL